MARIRILIPCSAFLVIAAGGIIGCGAQREPGTDEAKPSASPSEAKPPAREKPVGAAVSKDEPTSGAVESAQPQSVGHLEGVVRFVGNPIPEPTVVPVGTDPEFCGKSIAKEDVVIDPQTRGVRWVIVRLEGAGLIRTANVKPDRLELDNRQCHFVPHAAVATVGSTIVVRNSDPVTHTTHAYFAAVFNPALPQGASAEYQLRRPGLVLIRCDQHGWMDAFIQVDRHPFHAVTDEQGRFRIEDIPAGQYQLVMWHERFLEQERKVTIEPDQTTKVEIGYSEKK